MISFGCFYFRQAGYASGSVRSCFCVCVCRDNFKKMSADFDEIFWVDSFLGQERTILPLQEGSELQSGSARGPLRRGCFAGSKGMRYTEFTATGWSRKLHKVQCTVNSQPWVTETCDFHQNIQIREKGQFEHNNYINYYLLNRWSANYFENINISNFLRQTYTVTCDV